MRKRRELKKCPYNPYDWFCDELGICPDFWGEDEFNKAFKKLNSQTRNGIKLDEGKIEEIVKTWLCKTVCSKRDTCPNAGKTKDTSKGYLCNAYVGMLADFNAFVTVDIMED